MIALAVLPAAVSSLISLLASALERVSKFQRWPQMHFFFLNSQNVEDAKAGFLGGFNKRGTRDPFAVSIFRVFLSRSCATPIHTHTPRPLVQRLTKKST